MATGETVSSMGTTLAPCRLQIAEIVECYVKVTSPTGVMLTAIWGDSRLIASLPIALKEPLFCNYYANKCRTMSTGSISFPTPPIVKPSNAAKNKDTEGEGKYGEIAELVLMISPIQPCRSM